MLSSRAVLAIVALVAIVTVYLAVGVGVAGIDTLRDRQAVRMAALID